MKAIPTVYKGVQFRSRLEATWAAFFDIHLFKWEYEPTDFNGYIPDFKVQRSDYHGDVYLWVEVKPSLVDVKQVFKKAEKSGLKGDLMVVGSKPLVLDSVPVRAGMWSAPRGALGLVANSQHTDLVGEELFGYGILSVMGAAGQGMLSFLSSGDPDSVIYAKECIEGHREHTDLTPSIQYLQTTGSGDLFADGYMASGDLRYGLISETAMCGESGEFEAAHPSITSTAWRVARNRTQYKGYQSHI